MKLPALKYLDLSTAHITAKDDEILRGPENLRRTCVAVHEFNHGYFVPVYGEQGAFAEMRKDLVASGLSAAFVELVSLCVEQGIDLIRLDADAPTIDGLPRFEW